MVQAQSPNVMNVEMNATWKQFLRRKVDSFIKWDLVRFFHDNPHTVDTAANIAKFVGRDSQTVQHELNGLARDGVLERQTVSEGTIYRLTTNPDTRDLIHNFVLACHNREFRVQAIQYVIHGMGSSQSRRDQ